MPSLPFLRSLPSSHPPIPPLPPIPPIVPHPSHPSCPAPSPPPVQPASGAADVPLAVDLLELEDMRLALSFRPDSGSRPHWASGYLQVWRGEGGSGGLEGGERGGQSAWRVCLRVRGVGRTCHVPRHGRYRRRHHACVR